ncbi:hypothetical protein EJ110_NYTH29122 [Nymphaea thermarum]|nr:hypothetical protein EJ110_NYTH29122 [Nymphaea thermarum]
MVGLYYEFLTTFSIGPSYLLLLRTLHILKNQMQQMKMTGSNCLFPYLSTGIWWEVVDGLLRSLVLQTLMRSKLEGKWKTRKNFLLVPARSREGKVEDWGGLSTSQGSQAPMKSKEAFRIFTLRPSRPQRENSMVPTRLKWGKGKPGRGKGKMGREAMEMVITDAVDADLIETKGASMEDAEPGIPVIQGNDWCPETLLIG